MYCCGDGTREVRSSNRVFGVVYLYTAVPLLASSPAGSVQFKMVCVRWGKPICAPLRLSEVSPTLPWKRFQCLTTALLSSFQGRSSSSFHACFLQAIDGVMPLALCPLVVCQSSQHFRSFEKHAICEGCFARQSVCSVISLHSGMSRVVHPQELSKVDVDHRHIPVWASHFQFSIFVASSLNL